VSSGPNAEGVAPTIRNILGATWNGGAAGTAPADVPPLNVDDRRRLELAEKVCRLYALSGHTGIERTPLEKAATQAYLDWWARYDREAPPVTDDDVRDLAGRRDEARARGLAHLRGDRP
jgi:hypothetical protein